MHNPLPWQASPRPGGAQGLAGVAPRLSTTKIPQMMMGCSVIVADSESRGDGVRCGLGMCHGGHARPAPPKLVPRCSWACGPSPGESHGLRWCCHAMQLGNWWQKHHWGWLWPAHCLAASTRMWECAVCRRMLPKNLRVLYRVFEEDYFWHACFFNSVRIFFQRKSAS